MPESSIRVWVSVLLSTWYHSVWFLHVIIVILMLLPAHQPWWWSRCYFTDVSPCMSVCPVCVCLSVQKLKEYCWRIGVTWQECVLLWHLTLTWELLPYSFASNLLDFDAMLLIHRNVSVDYLNQIKLGLFDLHL